MKRERQAGFRAFSAVFLGGYSAGKATFGRVTPVQMVFQAVHALGDNWRVKPREFSEPPKKQRSETIRKLRLGDPKGIDASIWRALSDVCLRCAPLILVVDFSLGSARSSFVSTMLVRRNISALLRWPLDGCEDRSDLCSPGFYSECWSS